MMTFLWAILAFAVLGGLCGLALAFADKVFAVPIDERVKTVRDLLPGANCGACGFAGCDAMAQALCQGEASISACRACAEENAAQIAALLGKEATASLRLRAQVMCCGKQDVTKRKFLYEGAQDCVSASKLGGGDKACQNGCLGLGSCVSACPHGAISVKDGVAAVDFRLCLGCGACAFACPKHLISLIPYESRTWVGCRSQEKGAVVREHCQVGCIGCRLCEKACPHGAISVSNNVASIDYEKCVDCGACAAACPRKIICHVPKKAEENA